MPGGAGRKDYNPMPEGGSGANYGASGTGNGHHVRTKTTFTPKTDKDTISTRQKASFITSGIGYATGIEPLKWAGRLLGLGKKKTEKQKSEAYTKKGFDVLNPNEMRAAKYKPVTPPDGGGEGEGRPQITLNTQSVTSTPVPEETGHTWNFQAYRKGQMIKANQGQFSQGKRFGPPPKKGPDPQGINAPLNSIDYFKDLL